MQAIQNAGLCLVSQSELSPVLRQLQQCYNQITQQAAAPPIVAAIVQGIVAEVNGLQQSHQRKHVQMGPPQPGGARPKRVKTKKKHTEMPKFFLASSSSLISTVQAWLVLCSALPMQPLSKLAVQLHNSPCRKPQLGLYPCLLDAA